MIQITVFMRSGLEELTLDGNPLSRVDGYRSTVVGRMSSLKHLDLGRVGESDRSRGGTGETARREG
jgi:hypothetical protein